MVKKINPPSPPCIPPAFPFCTFCWTLLVWLCDCVLFYFCVCSICTREIRKFTLKRWFEFSLRCYSRSLQRVRASFCYFFFFVLFKCKRICCVLSVCGSVCLLFLIICLLPLLPLQQCFVVILWTSFFFCYFSYTANIDINFFVCFGELCFCLMMFWGILQEKEETSSFQFVWMMCACKVFFSLFLFCFDFSRKKRLPSIVSCIITCYFFVLFCFC